MDSRPSRPMPVEPGATGLDGTGLDGTVRVPVELDPQLHRQLMHWCRETAVELDVSGVARAAVLECLIEQLAVDERLAGAVLRRLTGDARPG